MATVKDLTGGTGDVNPQLLSITETQTAADTTTQAEVALPVPRVGTKKGRSIVIELLWVVLNWASYTLPPNTVVNYTALLSTASGAITTADPRTVYSHAAQFNLSGIGGGPQDGPMHALTFRSDFTDGAGHGVLIATDAVFFTVATTLSGAVNAANVKVAYRFKEVSLEEYIGIVASQQ